MSAVIYLHPRFASSPEDPVAVRLEHELDGDWVARGAHLEFRARERAAPTRRRAPVFQLPLPAFLRRRAKPLPTDPDDPPPRAA